VLDMDMWRLTSVSAVEEESERSAAMYRGHGPMLPWTCFPSNAS
jgi:hypothetical protein